MLKLKIQFATEISNNSFIVTSPPFKKPKEYITLNNACYVNVFQTKYRICFKNVTSENAIIKNISLTDNNFNEVPDGNIVSLRIDDATYWNIQNAIRQIFPDISDVTLKQKVFTELQSKNGIGKTVVVDGLVIKPNQTLDFYGLRHWTK